MKSSDEMVRLNRKQAEFYDAIHEAQADKGHGGYAENKSANLLTKAWAQLRYRQQAAVKEAGIVQKAEAFETRWIKEKWGGDFLELGCFSGSRATFLLVEASGSYLGLELSPKAVETLNGELKKKCLDHKAKALALDFLQLDESLKFDLVYAHGVLHHFENPEVLFEKLSHLLKDGGLLLFAEPSAVHPVYRMARALYRPFQSDSAWEWPFTMRTVRALEARFEIVAGFGWGRWSLPLSILTGLPILGVLARAAYRRSIMREVEQGWHPRVWRNSYVTAAFRPRVQISGSKEIQ